MDCHRSAVRTWKVLMPGADAEELIVFLIWASSWVFVWIPAIVGGVAERYRGEITIVRGWGGSSGVWVGLLAGVEGIVGCWGSWGGRTGFR